VMSRLRKLENEHKKTEICQIIGPTIK